MDKIIEILEEIHPGVDYASQTALIDDGILDSLEVMSLVVALSDEFDVDITPLQVVPENFQTVEAMHKLIQRLQDED